LTQAKKLSKKELKQPDEFQERGSFVLQHLMDNKTRYLLYLGIGIGVLVIWVAVDMLLGWRQDRISRAFADAMLVYNAQVVDAADENTPPPSGKDPTFPNEEAKMLAASEKFQAFVNEHGSSSYGQAAKFYLANTLFNLKRYAKAREVYEDFLKTADGGLDQFAFLANFNIAQTYEAEDNSEKAIASYQTILDSKDNVWKDQATYNIARLHYKAGKSDEAVKLLEELQTKYPDSSLKAQTDRLLLVIRGPVPPKPPVEPASAEAKDKTKKEGEGG